MKNSLFFFVSIIFFNYAQSQSQAKIDNYKLGDSDVNVVIFSFGMENPMTIGTISKTGDINFNFPDVLPEIPEEVKESMTSELWYTMFSQCENSMEMVTEKDNIFSFEAGALSLSTKDNSYEGIIFMVSDENLIPWIEDSGYMEPVFESYFELIYVAKPFQYQGSCDTGRMLDEGEARITYNYNLNLKAGFNFIEYKIESIYKTDPNVMASFPNKVTITNVDGIPNCKWIGKYFYN